MARYGILLITWSYDIGKVARYGILLITWSYNIEKVARCGIYWLQRWLPALGCYTTFTRSPCLLRPLGQWPVYDHREHWCYQATKSTFNLRDATTDQRKNNSSNQSISVGWMLGQHLMHWASVVPAFVILFSGVSLRYARTTVLTEISRRWPNAGLMLAHRLRRWPSIKPTPDGYFTFTGMLG